MTFGVKTRRILQYTVVNDFKMPGMYKPRPFVFIRGLIDEAMVKKGRVLFIRFDDQYPNVIDVETDHSKVFQLTDKEWLRIKNNLIQKINDSRTKPPIDDQKQSSAASWGFLLEVPTKK